jgi:hypothetical protein
MGSSGSQLACKGLSTGFRAISASTALGVDDCVVLITASSVIVTLPSPGSVGPGATYTIKASAGIGGTVLQPPSGNIDGQYASYPIPAGTAVRVVTDGTNWYFVDAPMPVVVALRFPYLVPTTSPTNVIAYSVPVAGMYRVSGYLLCSTTANATVTTIGGDGPSQPFYYWQAIASLATAPVVLNFASLAHTSYTVLTHTVHAAVGGNLYVSVTAGTASTLTISATLELVAID